VSEAMSSRNRGSGVRDMVRITKGRMDSGVVGSGMFEVDIDQFLRGAAQQTQRVATFNGSQVIHAETHRHQALHMVE